MTLTSFVKILTVSNYEFNAKCQLLGLYHLLFALLNHHLIANMYLRKSISTLGGNLNSGLSYLVTTVSCSLNPTINSKIR